MTGLPVVSSGLRPDASGVLTFRPFSGGPKEAKPHFLWQAVSPKTRAMEQPCFVQLMRTASQAYVIYVTFAV